MTMRFWRTSAICCWWWWITFRWVDRIMSKKYASLLSHTHTWITRASQENKVRVLCIYDALTLYVESCLEKYSFFFFSSRTWLQSKWTFPYLPNEYTPCLSLTNIVIGGGGGGGGGLKIKEIGFPLSKSRLNGVKKSGIELQWNVIFHIYINILGNISWEV